MRGRPTQYTSSIALEICDRLAGGESLRAICKCPDMPAESTVRKWAVDDRSGFFAQYTRARAAQMDAFVEDIIEIADDTSTDVNRSRLQIDARKWLMSKIAPKRFGNQTSPERSEGVTLEELVLASMAQQTSDDGRSEPGRLSVSIIAETLSVHTDSVLPAAPLRQVTQSPMRLVGNSPTSWPARA
jgi:hypothetical protein